jgi:hypothetical protein
MGFLIKLRKKPTTQDFADTKNKNKEKALGLS